MTKEVLVSISGLQEDVNEMENGDNEAIEVVSPGTYFFKDDKHYIFFEEMAEGFSETTKTRIELRGQECLEVNKKGASNMHMVFDINKKNRAYYSTQYGQLNLGIFTKEIMVDETTDNINIRVDYMMDVNNEPLAECKIRINVKPRNAKDFSITDIMGF